MHLMLACSDSNQTKVFLGTGLGWLYQAEVCVVCLTLPWLAVPGRGMCSVCDVTMVGCTRQRYVLCV